VSGRGYGRLPYVWVEVSINISYLIDDDDDDDYLHRIHSQHKLENYAPYVKYRPAKKA
jgi:hypothetical protein